MMPPTAAAVSFDDEINRTTLSGDDEESSIERDEILEVERMASRDTFIVRFWRTVVSSCFAAMAISITYAAYGYLEDDQTESFRTAFEQFSGTVKDAMVILAKRYLFISFLTRMVSLLQLQQMDIIHTSYETFCNTYSALAYYSNSSWPEFKLPHELENSLVKDMMNKTSSHIWIAGNVVRQQERTQWIEFVNRTYSEAAVARISASLSRPDINRKNIYLADIFTYGIPIGENATIAQLRRSRTPDAERPFYIPVISSAPDLLYFNLVNWNCMALFEHYWDPLKMLRGEAVLTLPYQLNDLNIPTTNKQVLSPDNHLYTTMARAIHEVPLDYDSRIVALSAILVAWDMRLNNLLPDNVKPIHAIIRTHLNQSFSFEIRGSKATYLGEGDRHDLKFDSMVLPVDLDRIENNLKFKLPQVGRYSLHLYPTLEFEAFYHKSTPEVITALIAGAFAFSIGVFLVYDLFVERRNRRLVFKAARSNAIVSSLFPGRIRDRLIGEGIDTHPSQGNGQTALEALIAESGEAGTGSTPLAEVFPETSLVFADVVGFTAWSSLRSPSMVFQLLETLYASFDEIGTMWANCAFVLAQYRYFFQPRLTVFTRSKRLAGVPYKMADHAVSAVLFAQEILTKMHKDITRLELMLGPGTSCLDLRIGIHSGAVTAVSKLSEPNLVPLTCSQGVLRGDKARFQLFGDTVNTASRLESTGQAGRIHLSHETAELLNGSGLRSWVTKRQDPVTAKGLGSITTWFLTEQVSIFCSTNNNSANQVEVENRLSRLIEWSSQHLAKLLRSVVAQRLIDQDKDTPPTTTTNDVTKIGSPSAIPLDEFKEIIDFPVKSDVCDNINDVHLPALVEAQLVCYVSTVAALYQHHCNPFHGFDHASNVMVSLIQIMDAFNDHHLMGGEGEDNPTPVTFCPLTRFAAAFSALIHDVGHRGVPNDILNQEVPGIGAAYRNKSVAEQNAIDVSWRILMEERFRLLLTTICSTPDELKHFRQVVVNLVLQTDIVDKESAASRAARWGLAFNPPSPSDDDSTTRRKRRTTAAIEHIMQASDIMHTMQNFIVFKKWNELLFLEQWGAFQAGRSSRDPTEYWFTGEMHFFDTIVIPLAKRLKEAFGESADCYYKTALRNRAKWTSVGKEIVAKMREKAASGLV